MATAIKLAQEVQGYLRSAKIDLALMRLQDIKIVIGQINPLNPLKAPALEPEVILRKVNYLINAIEKDIQMKTKELSTIKANAELEIVVDALVALRKTQIHGS